MALSFFNGTALGSSAAFLEIPVGARSSAMGGAYSSLPGGPDSLGYNPGAAAFISLPAVSLMHARYADGMSHDWVAGARPAFGGVTAFSLDSLSTGDIDSYDVSGNAQGSVSASDLALAVSHSRMVRPGLPFAVRAGLGISVKYITERLDTERAGAVAVDAGLLAETPVEGLRFSLAAQDFGTRMKFVTDSYSLPSRFRGGLSYGTEMFGVTWNYAAELLLPSRGRGAFLAGIEAYPYRRLAVRAGWQNARDMGSHLTCGLGFGLPLSAVTDMDLDYAFADYGDFGYVHRFSLNFRFNGGGK